MMVKYSSWGMIFFGMAAATMLVVGACFMMYYVNFHATQTGRTWIKVSFITAPLCAIAGLSQYIALTLEFGCPMKRLLSPDFDMKVLKTKCAATTAKAGSNHGAKGTIH